MASPTQIVLGKRQYVFADKHCRLVVSGPQFNSSFTDIEIEIEIVLKFRCEDDKSESDLAYKEGEEEEEDNQSSDLNMDTDDDEAVEARKPSEVAETEEEEAGKMNSIFQVMNHVQNLINTAVENAKNEEKHLMTEKRKLSQL